MKISTRTKGKITKAAALTLDVGAPLIATLTQFPVWVDRSASSTVSGIFVVFAILSVLPLIKFFGGMLKTPSIPVVFGISLGILVVIRTIIDEMILICFVGALANFIGMAMYKVGAALDKEEKSDG